MPNIKSAEKRVKVIAKKTERNRVVKSAVKTFVKKVRTAAPAQQETQLAEAFSALDKAASKGILHKNTVNRKKARLAKAVSKA